MASDELLAMAVNRVTFLKPREKLEVVEACCLPDRFASLTRRELEEIIGRRVAGRFEPPRLLLEQAREDRKRLTRGEFQCTFYWKRDFPPQLREIFDPPVVIYYRGRLPDWSRPLVAVVGTRHPTGDARECCYALAFELSCAGITTVSGLARGIDAEAHRGSVDGGGATIAVLGNGIDLIFPQSSRKVGRRLLNHGGALIAEYPPGFPPLARHFPARNRIISGLARTVVVVQAPVRSGALITADYALEQGRDLVVHQCGLAGKTGEGTRGLADQGAEVVRTAGDLLAGWGVGQRIFPVQSGEEHAGSRETGRKLARLLELEMTDRAIFRNGKVFKKL
jgi:DNA processing protein